jgi:DNA-binding MarR family transcriptional regulator
MNARRATAEVAVDPKPAEGRLSIIRLISRVRVELIDAMDRELAQFDISAPQMMVLGLVANQESPLSAATICKNISYDPGAMTRMIDRLQQKGLVRRVPNPDDRRLMNLEMTAAGRSLYPQLLAAKETVQAQFLRGFSRDEVRQLETLLARMLDNR